MATVLFLILLTLGIIVINGLALLLGIRQAYDLRERGQQGRATWQQ